MESEKVKEIKKALDCCRNSGKGGCKDCPYYNTRDCVEMLNWDMGDYINELESENERLNKSDTSKEESLIEYYNLYKDFKRKNKDLNELCESQRVSIAESFVRENQLKDRIAELECSLSKKTMEYELLKCGKKIGKGIVEVATKTKEKLELLEFAERLKEKFGAKMNWLLLDCVVKDIDETLKEFINKGESER